MRPGRAPDHLRRLEARGCPARSTPALARTVAAREGLPVDEAVTLLVPLPPPPGPHVGRPPPQAARRQGEGERTETAHGDLQ